MGVEECTDQPFTFRANAVGHRRANAQISLAAIAVKQRRECGGHGHEQGQTVLRVERTNPRGEFVAKVETEQLTLMALHWGTRTVTRQFQQRMFTTELRGPVVELALTLAGFQPVALPDAVVEVLHRQRLKRRITVIDKGFVQRTEFSGENIHRPAFGDDVVQSQDKVMFVLGSLHQTGAQQRAGFQIERQMSFVIGQLLNLLLTHIGGKF
ncbi:hypothetical protein D3C87_1038960 [compost metagenome]